MFLMILYTFFNRSFNNSPNRVIDLAEKGANIR